VQESLRFLLNISQKLQSALSAPLCPSFAYFFCPEVRLGSGRPWWSTNRDNIYQGVRESKKVENRWWRSGTAFQYLLFRTGIVKSAGTLSN